jgi:hypothetical protein
MKASTVLGGIFAVLAAFELVGVAILTRPSVHPETVAVAANQSPTLVTLAMAWVFGLWAALVAFMVYVIAWVGDGMAAGEEDIAVLAQRHQEEHPSTATSRQGQSQLIRAS